MIQGLIRARIHTLLTFLAAVVWLVNGLYCKLLNYVPRHRLIVSRILGDEYSVFFTRAIGCAEIGMAIWILSGFKSRFNTITQIVIIALMNSLEFFLVPDLLLWGRMNSVYAILFILLLYFNEFYLNTQPKS